MIKLMEMPEWVENPNWFDPTCRISYFNSTQIKNKFWDYDKWKGPYIPSVLKDKNWEPEEGKTYKCWWYWTNPADPADSGEDILVYIEELEKSNKTNEEDTIRNEYILKINDYISKISLNKLKNIYENIKKF